MHDNDVHCFGKPIDYSSLIGYIICYYLIYLPSVIIGGFNQYFYIILIITNWKNTFIYKDFKEEPTLF